MSCGSLLPFEIEFKTAFSTNILSLTFLPFLPPTLQSLRYLSFLGYSSLYISLSRIFLKTVILNMPLLDSNSFLGPFLFHMLVMLHAFMASGKTCCSLILFIRVSTACFKSSPATSESNSSFAYPKGSLEAPFFQVRQDNIQIKNGPFLCFLSLCFHKSQFANIFFQLLQGLKPWLYLSVSKSKFLGF